jgi:hypothetical protein
VLVVTDSVLLVVDRLQAQQVVEVVAQVVAEVVQVQQDQQV